MKAGSSAGAMGRRGLLLASLAVGCAGPGCAGPETPAGGMSPRLVEVAPSIHTVSGPLPPFDPRHPSVDLRLPGGVTKPPLLILVHGGGGARDQANAMALFHAQGVAVLGFDAYRLAGLEREAQFWIRHVTYEARQRMIYAAALGAYRWATTLEGVDTSRIFIHGLSNGADVVANLAAVASPAHIRMVFAEGLAGAGLGLPDRLSIPLRAVFGRLDNYAGSSATDWRWARRVPCRLNMAGFDGPPGNAARCNATLNAFNLTESPEQWVARQRAAGADIDTWFYDDAAHGILAGQLRFLTVEWPGRTAPATIGATEVARQKLLQDMLAVIHA
jgi:poly(3-hydroxybutyrate) depolymerase